MKKSWNPGPITNPGAYFVVEEGYQTPQRMLVYDDNGDLMVYCEYGHVYLYERGDDYFWLSVY